MWCARPRRWRRSLLPHTKGETVIVSAQPLDIEALKAAIAATGYTVTGAEEKPYEKKGFFSFLKH